MTTYIRAETVPERSREYITPGKLYLTTNPKEVNGNLIAVDFIDDQGEEQHAYIPSSAHLDYQPWQVVHEADALQAEGSWRHRLLSWVRSLF